MCIELHLILLSTPQVVYNVGLCICLYDITKLDDSYIFPGDGASHTKGMTERKTTQNNKYNKYSIIHASS